MLATVICSCALMFTMLVLYKLDFYVEKQRMRIYKAVVVCAPLVSCAAVQSWAHARHVGGGWHVAEELIQWLLVFATCLLHILWKLLFIWEARPSKARPPKKINSLIQTGLHPRKRIGCRVLRPALCLAGRPGPTHEFPIRSLLGHLWQPSSQAGSLVFRAPRAFLDRDGELITMT